MITEIFRLDLPHTITPAIKRYFSPMALKVLGILLSQKLPAFTDFLISLPHPLQYNTISYRSYNAFTMKNV